MKQKNNIKIKGASVLTSVDDFVGLEKLFEKAAKDALFIGIYSLFGGIFALLLGLSSFMVAINLLCFGIAIMLLSVGAVLLAVNIELRSRFAEFQEKNHSKLSECWRK